MEQHTFATLDMIYRFTSWVTRCCSGKVCPPWHSIIEIPPSALTPSFLSTLPISLGIEIPLPIAPLLPVHPPRLHWQPPPPLPPSTSITRTKRQVQTDITILYI